MNPNKRNMLILTVAFIFTLTIGVWTFASMHQGDNLQGTVHYHPLPFIWSYFSLTDVEFVVILVSLVNYSLLLGVAYYFSKTYVINLPKIVKQRKEEKTTQKP